MGSMRVVGICAAGLGLLLTGACGTGDGDGSKQPGAAGGTCTAQRAGGSITMGTFSEPQGLDPVGQPGGAVTGGTEITALYDTLIDWDAKAQRYEPRVAQSLEHDASFTTWTLKLRAGIKFGNGDPLTAEAVKASISRHQAPENTQVSRGEAANIKVMEVVDDSTLRFVLTGPYPDFPHVLATDVGMITNPRVVQQLGPEEFAKNPRGAGVGPYELERYAPGEEIVLTAKDAYWDGPVCIKQLKFVRIAGAQATYEAFENGELDVAFLREPQVIAEARDAGYRDLSTLINAGEAVIMNGVAKAARPTANVKIRRAVVAAIDPKALNTRVFDGTALATSALVHDKTGGLQPTQGPGYDPDAARRLVQEAKADGWDGTVRLLADNSPTRVQESITVKALLEAVGFKVSLENTLALPDVIKRVAVDRDYDLAMWGPQFFTEGLWAVMNRQLNSQAPSNYYGYSDPRMDAALSELKAATTAEQKSIILGKMQDILKDNTFAAIFAAFEESNVYHDHVHGLRQSRGSIIRFDDAYVTEK